MSADPSLRKQQMIYAIALVLTIVGFAAIALLSQSVYIEQSSPYSVSSGQVADKNGSVLDRFGPQTEVNAKQNSMIVERDNSYFLPTGSTGLFQTYQGETYFYNGSGVVYIAINSPIKFNINNQLVDLDDVKAIFDADSKQLYLIAGEIDGVAKQNQVVAYQDSKFVASPIVRSQLNSTKFTGLISFVKDQKQLPDSLADLQPPTIEISEPSVLTTAKKEITIKGKTEASARITINNSRIEVNNGGEFSAVIGLVPGSNKLTIVATDGLNNIAEQTLTITRKSEVVNPVVSETEDCTTGDIENKLYCEINAYLTNSSATKLRFNDQLGALAEAYAVAKFDGVSSPAVATTARSSGIVFAASKEISVDIGTDYTGQSLLEQVLIKVSDLATSGYQEVGIGIYEDQLSLILTK
jgi:hypothetical protein